MSPFNDPNVHVRQRHVSAGHVPVSSSHTIHYRPGSEFDNPGQFGNYPGQVAAANNGDAVSHHSSYRNTPVPQVSADHSSCVLTRYSNTIHFRSFRLKPRPSLTL